MRAAAESAPIHAVINAMHKSFEFYTLITMTSLQFTHAQGLGYTKACIECHCQYRLIHGMV